jgi:hypothetical protein
MKIDLEDVVLVVQGTRKQAGRVIAVKDKKLKIELLMPSEDDEPFEVERHEVVANMGPSPKVGCVYGKKIEPIIHTADHPLWGSIRLMRHLNEVESKVLKGGLKSAARMMKERGLDEHVFPLSHLNIKESRGKYEGMYRVVAGEREIDLFPKTFESVEAVADLLAHELGHCYWFSRVPINVRAEWVIAYTKYVNTLHISDNVLRSVAEDINNHNDVLNNLYDNYDPETEEYRALDAIINHVLSVHNLKMDALEILHYHTLQTSGSSFVAQHAPTENMVVGEVGESPMTDYSMKNPDEFFAEAFRIAVTGKVLPKSLRKLMDRTLRS